MRSFSLKALQALALPEILFRIGWYLDGKELVLCLKVCRLWYSNFAPVVWANLHIGCLKPVGDSVSEYKYQAEQELRVRSIDIPSAVSSQEELLDIFQEKASWLRSLTFHSHVSPHQFKFGKRCTQLQAISISGPIPYDDEYTREYWASCKALIKQNRSKLRSLAVQGMTFEAWSKTPPGNPRWNPILSCVGHSNLRELTIVQCKIYGRHLSAFWTICERLERLSLEKVDFDLSHLPMKNHCKVDATTTKDVDTNISQATEISKHLGTARHSVKARFPTLLYLNISSIENNTSRRLLDLIVAECPRLKTLIWNFQVNKGTYRLFKTLPLEEFCAYLAAGTWPDLDYLKLLLPLLWLPEEKFAEILQQSKRPFQAIVTKIYTIQQPTFDILKQLHFSTLREATFGFLKEPWVLDVLASCPSLEIISAQQLMAPTIMSDKRPWVCLGLKEFRVLIGLSVTNVGSRAQIREQIQEQNRAVYGQLAKLLQLKVLDLSVSPSMTHMLGRALLALQLDMGLDLLSGLTKLEAIYLSKDQEMRRKDALWIVENWTRLKAIIGGRLSSRKISKVSMDKYVWDYELSRILNGHGILTPSSVYTEGYLDEERHLLGEDWLESEDVSDYEDKEDGIEPQVDTAGRNQSEQTQ
ncbi:hypothetical protein BGX28_006637 [Mortierella sp. GBA30]|nr:hypothetical protein BGX28_006637 [Mortierella sp. GBA30]